MSKLNVNELMIGDWVSYKGKPHKVNGIEDNHLCLKNSNGCIIMALPDEINSIPLTAEILEKNGFRTFGLIDAPKYGLWLNDGRIIELSRIDDGWRIWVFYNNIPMSLNYLHELQHALRLCGITHEIVL